MSNLVDFKNYLRYDINSLQLKRINKMKYILIMALASLNITIAHADPYVVLGVGGGMNESVVSPSNPTLNKIGLGYRLSNGVRLESSYIKLVSADNVVGNSTRDASQIYVLDTTSPVVEGEEVYIRVCNTDPCDDSKELNSLTTNAISTTAVFEHSIGDDIALFVGGGIYYREMSRNVAWEGVVSGVYKTEYYKESGFAPTFSVGVRIDSFTLELNTYNDAYYLKGEMHDLTSFSATYSVGFN